MACEDGHQGLSLMSCPPPREADDPVAPDTMDISESAIEATDTPPPPSLVPGQSLPPAPDKPALADKDIVAIDIAGILPALPQKFHVFFDSMSSSSHTPAPGDKDIAAFDIECTPLHTQKFHVFFDRA